MHTRTGLCPVLLGFLSVGFYWHISEDKWTFMTDQIIKAVKSQVLWIFKILSLTYVSALPHEVIKMSASLPCSLFSSLVLWRPWRTVPVLSSPTWTGRETEETLPPTQCPPRTQPCDAAPGQTLPVLSFRTDTVIIWRVQLWHRTVNTASRDYYCRLW